MRRRPRDLTRPPEWFSEGDDPDYRFSLANERTFLAWVRTALSLLAGSVAVVQLVPEFGVRGSRTALALVLGVAGTALAAFSYRRWAAIERAMRLRRALPFSPAFAFTAVSVTVVGVAVVALAVKHAA